MSSNSLLRPDCNLLGAGIEKVENGDRGVQAAIFVRTKDNKRFMITVSNSKQFIITEVANDLS